MGNCCSDVSSGAGAIAGVGGTAAISSARGTTNDAVDYYLKSRGFNGLFSHIEVPSLHHFFSSFCFYLRVLCLIMPCLLFLQLSFSASNLRDRDVLSKVIRCNGLFNLMFLPEGSVSIQWPQSYVI